MNTTDDPEEYTKAWKRHARELDALGAHLSRERYLDLVDHISNIYVLIEEAAEDLAANESDEERAERLQAEAESKHEAEQQARYERWLDEGKGRGPLR